ncbi:MAG: ABC transporter ATP-binding protein/permease [Deltaproteobacteria bacterium]|jgi:ATP-binding cassette subfamily B protein|nr:ABC transporter ATP-binding protein/permease [Deltaproteobacteria bacterium]
MAEASKAPPRPGLKRLLRLSEAKKVSLIVSAIFAVISSVLSLAPYVLLALLLGGLVGEGELSQSQYDQALSLALWVAGLAALRYLLLFISTMASHMAAFEILYRIRVDLCERLGHLSMGYFSLRQSGKIKKILTEDVENLEQFLAHHIPDIVAGVVQPIAVVACLFYFDWRLALVALIPLPLAAFLQRLAFGRDKENEYRREYHDVLEVMNGTIVEYVRGMPVVKIFNQTAESFSTLKKAALGYEYYLDRLTRLMAPAWAMFVVTTTSGLLFLLPFGLWFYLNGTITFQNLALFLMLGSSYMSPVLKLALMGGQLNHLIEGLVRVDEVFNEKPQEEKPTLRPPAGYDVEFNEVSFKYGQKPIVQNVSFKLKEGGVYALVGPSGAGKSTLARLLTRMWDIESGSIAIGGVDVRDLSFDDLMKAVSFVFQDTFLFSDTVRENIRMNNQAATDQEILAAASAAQCLDFINSMPNGLDTLIGEGGEVHLSGGEKQRLSLARVILKKSPIVVLDEATVFNDAENEARIQEAFVSLMEGKTVLVIAHRLSTIVDADAILVIDEGQIVQMGSHEELLAEGGLYRNMWTAHEAARKWKIGEEAANA